ncbi:mannitol dehydrogenase family protein [Deinococcus deserti]|uniref:Putative mannitol 2-dehydrogenase n=1 Tax=Deinococcus deserti (strain DSM 17065 / CIP 109153 / LMG 22923 / VCD115) TaxID=546414 RepID=C1D3T9_DEIDV|nr:mannitol dehydrogenase family protein [Deinococcus deserti]ACO48168.1 putative mannitol 2-dehydrogenase [Deinococcus deserti VCD115]
MTVKLNASTLATLNRNVAVPQYDPSQLTSGIVHFGVGAFHRAHQAMYLDRLLNTGAGSEWAICGVGLLPGDARMRDVFAAQDNLYTLVTRSPEGHSEACVIGAIREYLYAPDSPEAVLEKLADPATKIVSLTITEGGYGTNNATGEFDPSTPELQHDLTEGAVPRTVFGFITEGLRRRRERGLLPFTVMSCDNMQGNGHVTARAFISFARLKNPELAEWISQGVAFPNSMVDRITPVTTPQIQQDVADQYGIDDAWPVVAESFTQWVLEDTFTLGRPPLEQVGVQLVQDVEPYELMKLRLLNATHQAMGQLGLLAGYTYAHEVCQDPVFVDFLLGYMIDEATPTLHPVPGVDIAAYREQLIARFASTAIQDTLARLVVDGSERIPKFLLPVVRERLAAGGSVNRSALVVAAWSRYIAAAHEGHYPALVDPRAESITGGAVRDVQHPGAFLELQDIFGDLAQNARFREAYLTARNTLDSHGALGAIQVMVQQHAAAPVQPLSPAFTSPKTATNLPDAGQSKPVHEETP